ncbi:MAG TPA: hypothetical protein VF414_19710 [Thermoanaerobaculia bacterium]
MSCPDWSALAAHRNDVKGVEPQGWTDALAHFDSCSLCRRQALAADPTLVFRRMPVPELSPAEERDEVAAVRQAVAALRTASRLDALETRPRPLSFSGWKRWAAAAVLVLASLSLGQSPGTIFQQPQMSGAALQPAVEAVNLPDARVYQVGEEDLLVTMIVDESLDV